jgi:pimeloyl-ACP methyl ester carboxylesterase
MPIIHIGSGDMFYAEHGEGFPLIALHAGLGSGMGDFRKYIPILSPKYRFILPDRIGYGKSAHVDTFREPFFSRQVDDLIEFMVELDIEKGAFWGWSDGTVMALNLAIRRPELVSLIIAQAGHYCPIKETTPLFERFLEPDKLTEREIRSFSRQHGDSYWKALLRKWAERWLKFNQTTEDFYDGRLNEVRCPVIFLIGDEDEHVMVWEFKRMHEIVKDSELFVLKGAGHATHLGKKQVEFSRAMLSFLSAHL